MSTENTTTFASDLQGSAAACIVRLRVIPGSRRDQIVGPYGDRLKVKVAAPPEDGRANQAVCELLAAQLGIASRAISILAGHASQDKVVQVNGLAAQDAVARLVPR